LGATKALAQGTPKMNKIRAAGDEEDGWIPRTAEEVRDAGLWDAVRTASIEIEDLPNAMIFEQGRDWTRLWHELGLSRFDESDGVLVVGEDAAAALLNKSTENSGAFDLLVDLAASMIEKGIALPHPWRSPFASYIRGEEGMVKPKKTSKKSHIWVRNYMLNHVARILCNQYDESRLNLKRGKESSSVSASDILFHAIQGTKFDGIGFGTIQNIIFDPNPRNGVSRKNQEDFEDVKTQAIISIFDDYPE